MLVERWLGDFADIGLYFRYRGLPEAVFLLIGGGNLFLRRCDSLRQLLILGDIRLDSLHAAEICLYGGHQLLTIFQVGILEVLQGDVIGINQLLLADGARKVLGLLNALIDPFAVGILAGAVVQQAGIVHHAPEVAGVLAPVAEAELVVGHEGQHGVVCCLRCLRGIATLDGRLEVASKDVAAIGIRVSSSREGIHAVGNVLDGL